MREENLQSGFSTLLLYLCLKGCFSRVGVKFAWIVRSCDSVRFVLPLLLSAYLSLYSIVHKYNFPRSQHALVIKAKKVHNCEWTGYSLCTTVLQINCKRLVGGFPPNAPTASFKGVDKNDFTSCLRSYIQTTFRDEKSRDEMLTPLKLKKEFMGCPFHSPFSYWGAL